MGRRKEPLIQATLLRGVRSTVLGLPSGGPAAARARRHGTVSRSPCPLPRVKWLSAGRLVAAGSWDRSQMHGSEPLYELEDVVAEIFWNPPSLLKLPIDPVFLIYAARKFKSEPDTAAPQSASSSVPPPRRRSLRKGPSSTLPTPAASFLTTRGDTGRVPPRPLCRHPHPGCQVQSDLRWFAVSKKAVAFLYSLPIYQTGKGTSDN